MREQVEFNREVIGVRGSHPGGAERSNRTLVRVGGTALGNCTRLEGAEQEAEGHSRALDRVALGVGTQAAANEIQFLRSVADLQGAFQHRVTLMEANFRDADADAAPGFRSRAGTQHAGYSEELWDDLERSGWNTSG